MDPATTTTTGHGKGSQGSAAAPASASPATPAQSPAQSNAEKLANKVFASLEQQAEKGVPGYRKGEGTGLTETPIKTAELCSWLQVPAILQELQSATQTGKQVDIRLLFPEPNPKDKNAAAILATQAEIKKFFQAFHSKSAGEMYKTLTDKLGELEKAGGLPKGLTAKDWLDQFQSLKGDNKSVLSVTDVIDLKSNPKALASKDSLLATLTEASKVAGERKVAIVVDNPSQEATALAAALREPGVDLSTLKNMRVWVGSLDYDSQKSKGKKLEEVTLEDFLKNIAPKDDKNQAAEKKEDTTQVPPPLPDPKSTKGGGGDDPPSNGGGGTGVGITPPGGSPGTASSQPNQAAPASGVASSPDTSASTEPSAERAQARDPELEKTRAAQKALVEEAYKDDPVRLSEALRQIDNSFDAVADLRSRLAQRLAGSNGAVADTEGASVVEPRVAGTEAPGSVHISSAPAPGPVAGDAVVPKPDAAGTDPVAVQTEQPADLTLSSGPAADHLSLAGAAAPAAAAEYTPPPAPVASEVKTGDLSTHTELVAVSPAFFTSTPSSGAPAIKSYDLNTGGLVLERSEGKEQRVVFPTAAGMELKILDGRFLVVSFRNAMDASKSMECDPPFDTTGATPIPYQKIILDIGRLDSSSKVPVLAVPSSGSPVSYMSEVSELASRIRVAYLSSVAEQYPDRLEAVTGFTKYTSDRGSSTLFRHPEGVDLAGSGWHNVSAIAPRSQGGLVVTETDARGTRLWQVTLNGADRTYSAKRLES